MGRTVNPYQRSLVLKVNVRDPTIEDLRAAYQRCGIDQQKLPFERALAHPAIGIGIWNTAKAAIVRNGGR